MEIFDENQKTEAEKRDTEFFLNKIKIESFSDIKDTFATIHKGLIKLKVFLLISSLTTEKEMVTELKNFFMVKEKKDLYIISPSETESIEAYIKFVPFDSTFILFSYNTQEDIEALILNKIVKNNSLFSSLWLTQELTQNFIQEMEFKSNLILFDFSGEYRPEFKKKSVIRPKIGRRIKYSGTDSLKTYFEMNRDYGIRLEQFTAFCEGVGLFQFKRKTAEIIFREGDFIQLYELALWLIRESRSYLEKIKQFKKVERQSLLSIKKSWTLSNDLVILFETSINSEMIDLIYKKIEETENIKVLSSIVGNKKKGIIWNIKFMDNNTKGIYKAYFGSNSSHLFQVYNANFLGVFTYMDILDFCQPIAQISVN